MSILIVEILDCGIIFGADRNVTSTTQEDGPSQEPEDKIFRWPRDDVLFGYVGAARIRGVPFQLWLEEQREEYASIDRLSNIAEHLKHQVEAQRRIDEGGKSAEGLIIHLAGFEDTPFGPLPQVWHVANVRELGPLNYKSFAKEFYAVDGFAEEITKEGIEHGQIRAFLRKKAEKLEPAWFHQGFDYVAFNTLDLAAKAALKHLFSNHPDYVWPVTLDDWGKRVAFSIYMYSAYFKAYKDKNDQLVGGGCDILALPWPDN